MNHAVAPDQRPTWFVLLSSLMLMLGGAQVGSAASVLVDPGREIGSERSDAQTDDERALEYQYSAQGAAVFRQHAALVRGLAGARLAAGLLMLYAAAAALMRDRRGRTMAMLAAGAAVPYHVANTLVAMRLWREIAARLEPWVGPAYAATGKVTPDELAKVSTNWIQRLQFHPLPSAAMGVFFSLIILWYFGGRRGRTLYGLNGLGR